MQSTSSEATAIFQENMQRNSNNVISRIKKLKAAINKLIKTSSLNREQNLLKFESIDKKFSITLGEFQTLVDNKFNPQEEARKCLDNLFGDEHAFYLFKLELMVTEIEKNFKMQDDSEIDQEVLKEVLHTVLNNTPDFYNYFKYKTGAHRVPIKQVNFLKNTSEHARDELLASKDFDSKMGHEKILIATFPQLSPQGFAEFVLQLSNDKILRNKNVINNIYLYGKNSIIFYFKGSHPNMLDVHGLDLQQACRNIAAYIQRAFFEFQNQIKIVTGQGNHSVDGTSVIKNHLIELLEELKQKNSNVVSKFHIDKNNPGIISIKFHKPVVINSVESIHELIQNNEHRIIVKFDQQCSPEILDQFAMKIIVDVIRLHPGTVAHCVPQKSLGDNSARFVFSEEGSLPFLFGNTGFHDVYGLGRSYAMISSASGKTNKEDKKDKRDEEPRAHANREPQRLFSQRVPVPSPRKSGEEKHAAIKYVTKRNK